MLKKPSQTYETGLRSCLAGSGSAAFQKISSARYAIKERRTSPSSATTPASMGVARVSCWKRGKSEKSLRHTLERTNCSKNLRLPASSRWSWFRRGHSPNACGPQEPGFLRSTRQRAMERLSLKKRKLASSTGACMCWSAHWPRISHSSKRGKATGGAI